MSCVGPPKIKKNRHRGEQHPTPVKVARERSHAGKPRQGRGGRQAGQRLKSFSGGHRSRPFLRGDPPAKGVKRRQNGLEPRGGGGRNIQIAATVHTALQAQPFGGGGRVGIPRRQIGLPRDKPAKRRIVAQDPRTSGKGQFNRGHGCAPQNRRNSTGKQTAKSATRSPVGRCSPSQWFRAVRASISSATATASASGKTARRNRDQRRGNSAR